MPHIQHATRTVDTAICTPRNTVQIDNSLYHIDNSLYHTDNSLYHTDSHLYIRFPHPTLSVPHAGQPPENTGTSRARKTRHVTCASRDRIAPAAGRRIAPEKAECAISRHFFGFSSLLRPGPGACLVMAVSAIALTAAQHTETLSALLKAVPPRTPVGVPIDSWAVRHK